MSDIITKQIIRNRPPSPDAYEYLTKMDKEKLSEFIRKQVNDFISLEVPDEADGQVKRVAGRFGRLLAAGLIAI